MGNITAALSFVSRFIGRNLFKILLTIPLALFLAILIFPYSDLRSFVATKLSRSIGDGVTIDFNKASLAFGFPFALELEKFEFVFPGLPTVTADQLIAKPGLIGLFTQSPSGSVEAEGLFKGHVHASLAAGSKSKSGSATKEVSADVTGLDLDSLTTALKRAGLMSFVAQGALESRLTAIIDTAFQDQPNADLMLVGNAIAIPSVSIAVPNMGSVQTPSLQLTKVEFKGKLTDGKLQIEEFTFGQGKDNLSGRVRGEMGLMIQNDPQGTRPIPGAYDLKVELNISKSMMDAMGKSGVGLALLMVEKHKTVGPETTKFAFRIKAPGPGVNPQFESLSN